jgi:GT2 family glycosyltransferase
MSDKIEIVYYTLGDTYIHNARTKLAKTMMQWNNNFKADYVLHLDSDMVFESEDVFKLIKSAKENDLDIVSGIYFTKSQSGTHPLVFKEIKDKNIKNGSIEYLSTYPSKLFEADGVGFGFLLCKPKVYADLFKKYGWFFFDYERTQWGQNCGEDVVWCKRVREEGYRIMVEPKIILGHAGGVVGIDNYKAFEFKKRFGALWYEKIEELIHSEKN